MNNLILTKAITDYYYIDGSNRPHRMWDIGMKWMDSTVTLMDYNLTYQSLDVYLEDGNMVRVFNVRDLLYTPPDA